MKDWHTAQDIQSVTAEELLPLARNLKDDGYRLGQICATTKKHGFEILYTFAKEMELKNYRLTIGREDKVESITEEFWPAFIYENEMHDLFGIEFLHNALDYGGNFFVTATDKPWLDVPLPDDDEEKAKKIAAAKAAAAAKAKAAEKKETAAPAEGEKQQDTVKASAKVAEAKEDEAKSESAEQKQ